jgi:hypothetical protein
MSVIVAGLILAAGCMDIANRPRQIATRVAGWSSGYADGARRLLTQQLRSEVGQRRAGEEETVGVSSDEDFRRALIQERTAREAAERAIVLSRAELVRQQAEKEAAEKSLREAREILAKERDQRLASEREYAEGLQRANQPARIQLARPLGGEELVAITARGRRERLAKERNLSLAAARNHREAQRRAELTRSAGRTQGLQNRYFNFSR